MGHVSDPILSIPIRLIRYLISLLPNITLVKIPQSSNLTADTIANAASLDHLLGAAAASMLASSGPPLPHHTLLSLSPHLKTSSPTLLQILFFPPPSPHEASLPC